MIPPLTNATTGINDFINTELGLAFHSDSAMLRGILEKVTAGNRALVNGAVIAARSENDTGNNPHNPMYGIYKAGANGRLLTLVGSRSSESGGNSMAPAAMIDNEVRPTKVDRPSDSTGLVDVGDLTAILGGDDIDHVMEAIYRISHGKISSVNTGVSSDAAIKELVRCTYAKSAFLASEYSDPNVLNPSADNNLVSDANASAPFSSADMNDREFSKTAAIAKLVIDGYAGAGTVTMGGYDYHTGDRATGESRDLRAGRCIGACLQYAANLGKPLMLYVFSDGSVFSNGTPDDSVEGRGKGVWTGDNQQTAASFFLVYNPSGVPQLMGGTPEQQLRHQQLGYYRDSGDVETTSSPAANNVNLLVETVVLNYLALHGLQGSMDSQLTSALGGHGLSGRLDELTAFQPLTGLSL
jgi:hypothetical protein